MYKITDIRCEYKINPIGIDVKEPRISWKTDSDERGVIQASYRIQVSKNNSFEEVFWDSGEVSSDQSIHIELTSLNMESRQRYYYRVQATNQKGESTGWSDRAFWETGFLSLNEWRGEWIAPPKEINGEPCPKLRREFQLNRHVKSARIYITALGLYDLELNGRRVGDAYFTPGWTSYQDRLQYQTYDVTNLLTVGNNEIGALLGNGWYKGNLAWEGQKEIYGDRLALLFQMHIELEDGTEVTILSDKDWEVSESPILMSELYHGEIYDARMESKEGKWQPIEVIPYTKNILVAQENDPVRKIEELNPIELIITPKDEIVIDMGQNMVGWVRFTVQGEAGKKVEILHAEVLDNEGNFYMDNLRSAKQKISYTLKSGEKETFEPYFSFQGFRYIQLLGFDVEKVSLEDFTGIVLHSDMETTGDFQCSDPLINQLQHNIKWGLKGNFLDVPTDCPQRDERLGWTGDAQIFIRTAAYLSNVAPFFTKWLRDLKSDQALDGGVPFVVPNVLGKKEDSTLEQPFSSAAWGDAAVICPWTIYQCYGDKRILNEQYESMKAWVEYIRSQGENEYLWNTGFHFGDWLALDSKPDSYIGATDRSFIATAFYAYSTSILKKVALVIGKKEDAEHYQELESKITEALTDEFVTPSGRLAVPTQTAQLLALMFDLLEGKGKERAIKKLTELLEESNFHLTTGFVGTPYLNHVLSQNGHNETAYKLLFQRDYPSWLYPVTKGATTIWEHWDGIKEDGSFWSEDMNSFNHYAYGAIGDWLYRVIAGINLDEKMPAYKKVLIHPQSGEGLTWAEGKLNSMYGLIRVYWKKQDHGKMLVEVTIPANSIAEVLLPNAQEEQVTESDLHLSEVSGVLASTAKDKGLLLELGSGNYIFRY